MAASFLSKRPWAWILLLVVGAAAAFFAWRTARPPEVQALRVEPTALVRTLQFSARVASDSRVDVGPTITGRVQRVRVQEGDRVEAGQLLVQLEQDEQRAALAQALASERQARVRLAGLRSTGRQAAGAAVSQAEAQWRSARTELARNEQLVAQGFVSAARLDEARRALEVATAQRDAALAQARASGDSGTEVGQAEAQIALARAAADAARARLEQTRLLAPAAGRVLARQVEPGQIVQPGRALVSLALDGPRQLVAQVDERFLEQLQVGQPATAVADAFPQQPFAARVSSLAPVVDPQRGALEIKLAMPQPPAFLREDLTVSVEVETGRRERALVVPLSALAGPERVRVAHEGRVELRKIRLGLRTLEAAEVLEGLAPGDEVLLADAPAPGRPVRVRIVPWLPGAVTPSGGSPEDAGSTLGQAMGR